MYQDNVQVVNNYSYLLNLRGSICKSCSTWYIKNKIQCNEAEMNPYQCTCIKAMRGKNYEHKFEMILKFTFFQM